MQYAIITVECFTITHPMQHSTSINHVVIMLLVNYFYITHMLIILMNGTELIQNFTYTHLHVRVTYLRTVQV